MGKKPFVRKDRFYFKAKEEGYPARSAYKIMELDDRFKIFKPRTSVIDLGCAPGGWLKVAEERLGDKSILVGIDLLALHYEPGPRTNFIQGDFTDIKQREEILKLVPHGAHWVISDLSPNISGISFRDHYQSFELCRMALDFAHNVLKNGGGFLCKTFPGQETDDLRKEMRKYFEKIVTVIPEATRKSSTEIYIVGLNKKSA